MESKRTIPQIRDEMLSQLNKVEEAFENLDEDGHRLACTALRELVEETKRRPCVRGRPAQARHPDPDPALIRAIRELERTNPGLPYAVMADKDHFDTSTRCISLALAGRRDGSPVFDETGVKIKRKRASVLEDDPCS